MTAIKLPALSAERPGPTHYQLHGPVLTFHVLGEPVGQGRISFLGKGRPAIHSNQDRLLPWRELVQHAAEAAIAEQQATFPLDGPVGVYACFTMPKAKSAPKTKTTWPTKRPDGSHLLRAIEDAMTNAGVWRDDSQLVDEHLVKAFPGEHISALHVPGVLIRVYTVGGA
jgi:Holliday junction resolvase RusA-like endonuclease